MKCPACDHRNLSDFPFCEQCLALLPAQHEAVAHAFEADGDDTPARQPTAGLWPPFPWNPPELEETLIGRDRALKELVASFEDAIETWHSRIHLLVSEYGMGKARVAGALVGRVVEIDPDTQVVRTRCPSAGGPFRLWDALLRRVLEMPADADEVVAGVRLAEACKTHLAEEGTPEEAEVVAGLIASLIGYEVPGRPEPTPGEAPDALVGPATAALARLLAATTARRPPPWVVDHANRATARSLTLAGAIEATLKARPLMIVLAGSFELTTILPGWERFPVTRLAPLGRLDAEHMLRLFLTGVRMDGGGDVPPDLVKRVLDRAHGNPYAIKSILRYMREAGAIGLKAGRWLLDEATAWDLELPDNLDGVVLAQVGTLSPEDRTTLARAAVIGNEFWLGALVTLQRQGAAPAGEPGAITSDEVPAAIRASLARLIEKRFIETRHDGAVTQLSGEEGYAFRSEVHRRVASSIRPQTTQARYHRIVWQWLLVHDIEEREEQLPELARHAEAAGAPGRAARYLLAAARHARTHHENGVARRHFEAAAALVEQDDIAMRIALGLDLGDALALAGDLDPALSCYQEVLQLAWQVRHRAKGATALGRIGRLERDRGRFDAAYGHLLQALRLFEAVRDRRGVAAVCNDLGRLFWLRGDFERALRFYRKSEALYRDLRERCGLAESIHCIGALHYDRGDLDLADEYLDDALELRRRLDDRAGITASLNVKGAIAFGRQELDAAVSAWQEALLVASAIGDLSAQAILANNLGEALTMLGQHAEARDNLQRAIDLARQADQPRALVDAWRNLAQLHVAEGAFPAAELALAQARNLAERLGLSQMSALVERSQGDLERARSGTEIGLHGEALGRAEVAYQQAAEAFETNGYDLEAARSREHLAEVLDILGRGEDAAAARETAARLRARHR